MASKNDAPCAAVGQQRASIYRQSGEAAACDGLPLFFDGLVPRADRLGLLFLLQCERPLEEGRCCGLRACGLGPWA